MQALRVKCGNTERNCEWEGTVGTLEEHVAVCEFALVPCPNKCKDDSGKIKHFIRKRVEEHTRKDCPHRDYICEYCTRTGTYIEITQVHGKKCEMKLVRCPNECSANVLQKNIEEHVSNECKNTVVPCKFQNIGCKREMKRVKMAAHENDDKIHLHMALIAVVKLQDANTKLQEANSEVSSCVAALKEVNYKLEENSQTLKKGEPIIFSVSKYWKKKVRNETFTCTPFYTHPNGYRMAVKVDANGTGAAKGTHVSVCAVLVRGKYYTTPRGPFVGTVTFALLNQLEDKNHHTETSSIDVERNTRAGITHWGLFSFIPHSALGLDQVKNTQYLSDDTLYFRVLVEVADHKPWLECTQ